jgi:serine phosphatase RsbU (regulator of sigma subunit)
VNDVWYGATADLLRRTLRCRGDELASEVNAATRRLGVEITVFLVDQEQRTLRALPEPGKPTPDPLPVDATLAGRAFTSVQTLTGRAGERWRLWVPVLDGTDRLGVLDVQPLELAEEPSIEVRRRYELLANLVGHLVVTKMPHGDLLLQVRRTQPMSVASELLWQLLPPMTFTCHELVLTAVLEPCYDVGGDAFDYAVDGTLANLAILDATGHDLRAGVTCAVALAAIRAARRDEHGLYAMGRAVDEALAAQFTDSRFVTAVLAELDTATGLLRYLNAGHPPPLLMRGGKVVRALDRGRRLPLGVDDAHIDVAEEILEPGDRLLLYTDGVVEARDEHGAVFGADRLIDLAQRHAAAGLPAPETLRRLAHDVLHHQHGQLHDDATLLLLEWSTAAVANALP